MINAAANIDQASIGVLKSKSPLPARAYLLCSLSLLGGAGLSVWIEFVITQSLRNSIAFIPLTIGGILAVATVITKTRKWQQEHSRLSHGKEVDLQRTISGLQMQVSESRTVAEAMRQARVE